MRLMSWGAALGFLLFAASAAHADPVQTISFSGTLQYGYDGSKFFDSTATDMTGDSYIVTFSYDPLKLSGDSCGMSSNVSCQWNFTAASNAQEIVTVNGITKTFTGTSGNIQFCACGNDAIYINFDGTSVEFGASLPTSGKILFSSQTNVNNTELLNNLSNVALNSGTFQSALSSTSFGASPASITTALTTAAPEPASLALLGAGLAGMAVVRRRKQT